jgi:outer membrane protein OmpA-like peptidoglycan-associated protein
MIGRRALAVVLVALVTCSMGYAGDDQDAVNQFYANFVKALKSDGASTLDLVRVVAGDRQTAQKCLEIMKQKAEASPENKEAFAAVTAKLDDALLLSRKGKTCATQVIDQLLQKSEGEIPADDKIMFLEKATDLCPQTPGLHHKLADAYLADRRLGMAVATYKKALKLKSDKDSESLMIEAEKLLDDYKQGKNLTVSAVRDLFRSALMAPAPCKLNRNVQMRTALQTQQVLFEPWSANIKNEFSEALETVGKVAKEEMERDKTSILLIEGHSDKRGTEDKNLEISEDRAEAVKNYLVKNFGLDAERIQVKGYGFFKPFAPDESADGHHMNRRVEFKRVVKQQNP